MEEIRLALFKTYISSRKREHVKKIALLFFPEHLGDYIIWLPYLNRLKQVFPQAKLHLYTMASIEKLARANRNIDEYFALADTDMVQSPNTLQEVKKGAAFLRKQNYDAAFFTHDPVFWYPFLAKIPIILREKSALQFRWFCYGAPHKMSARRYASLSVRYMNNLDTYTRQWAGYDDYRFDLGISKEQLTHPFKLPPSYIVFNSDFHSARTFDKEFFVQLLDYLVKTLHKDVVQVGLKDPYSLANGYSTLANYHSLVGKTNLLELVAVMKDAQLFVGLDSGTAHLSSAVGTPSLILYPAKGAQPWYFGPFNADSYLYKISAFDSHCPVSCDFFSGCRRTDCEKDYRFADVRAKLEQIMATEKRSRKDKNRETFQISVPILVGTSPQMSHQYLDFWKGLQASGYQVEFMDFEKLKHESTKTLDAYVAQYNIKVFVWPHRWLPLKFRWYEWICKVTERRLFTAIPWYKIHAAEDPFRKQITDLFSGGRTVI